MWRYYAHSNICYAYLADIPTLEAGWGPMFAKSEWFTRGWTLQELIALVCVEFYSENWIALGTKFELYKQIAEITSINPDALVRAQAIDLFSTAEKLSWASHRNVTREDDESYSLLGLFDINMPLLYGEGREKAFVRLQESIYNATADHSIFLFRYTTHDDAHPLLANSPTSFCNRVDCSPCLVQGYQIALPNIRYESILCSERWSTQSHEQIMTTVTMFRNEMSTVLPLLDYQDVRSKLVFLDKETPRVRITHVAVLNHTLEKYPHGALCLPLCKMPGMDACIRLPVFPAVLPLLGDFITRLEKTKLLICPGPSKVESSDCINVMFSVDSDLFRVEMWGVKGSENHSILPAQQGKCPDFRTQIRKPENPKRPVQVSCQLQSSQDPKLLLTIRLVRLQEIWSIKELNERKKGRRGRKLRTLFLSFILVDSCSYRFPDGKRLSVKLRRIASSPHTGEKDIVVTSRYQIVVDYQ